MFKDVKLDIKIKLSALWASATFCYLYGDYFELYTPGKIDSLLTGSSILDTPIFLLIASVLLAIPSVMVAASVLLKSGPSRILNIVFGSLFTLMMLFIGINSVTEWYSFYVFLAFLESIITFLIVWYAYNWPKQEING